MLATKDKVGVIGLGIMGGAFARHLAAAGWDVSGYDLDAKCRKQARGAGVTPVADAGEVAQRSPVIILSLPSAKALHAVADAIATANVPQRAIVEAGTFSLDDKLAAERTLRAAGHIVLDCPVSGTGSQVKTKDIVIYASGPAKTIAALRPMFATFAREVHDLGAFGNGSRMKYVANLLVAIHNVASAEAMVLGMKAGLDPKKIIELVRSGAGNSRVFELRAGMMADNRYDEATMRVSTWQKDMSVISDFATGLGCPTPLLSACEPIYAAAISNGHGADDTASVCAVLEAMAGMKRKRRR